MRILVASILAFSLLLVWWIWQEVPTYRGGGAESLPMETVATDVRGGLCPKEGEILELRGDSHVIGARMEDDHGTDKLPYGKIIQQRFGKRLTVLLRGRGGFTAELAENEWIKVDPKGDIVLLALGTNDAAPRGWLTRKEPVALEAFEASLVRQITRETQRSARVALIAPPPGGTVAINKRLRPYREAVRKVGLSQGVTVLDPADALANCTAPEPLFTRDALHLNAAGHRCLGNYVAAALCPKE